MLKILYLYEKSTAMYLNYTQALVLREIAVGKAELFINREPATLYINGSQIGLDPTDQDAWRALDLCMHYSLVQEKPIDGFLMVYSVTAGGQKELERHFPRIGIGKSLNS